MPLHVGLAPPADPVRVRPRLEKVRELHNRDGGAQRRLRSHGQRVRRRGAVRVYRRRRSRRERARRGRRVGRIGNGDIAHAHAHARARARARGARQRRRGFPLSCRLRSSLARVYRVAHDEPHLEYDEPHDDGAEVRAHMLGVRTAHKLRLEVARAAHRLSLGLVGAADAVLGPEEEPGALRREQAEGGVGGARAVAQGDHGVGAELGVVDVVRQPRVVAAARDDRVRAPVLGRADVEHDELPPEAAAQLGLEGREARRGRCRARAGAVLVEVQGLGEADGEAQEGPGGPRPVVRAQAACVEREGL